MSNECILEIIRSLRVRSLLYRKMRKVLDVARKHKLIRVHFLRCVLALQVKIRNRMDKVEVTELVGVSARFGEKISNRNVEIEVLVHHMGQIYMYDHVLSRKV
jgi:hypothetical protein